MDLKSQPQFLTQVKVHAARVNPGDILSIPWGWILCESVINNEMNIGLRLTDFNASAPPSIKALLATVAPKKDDIKPNTGVALLSKVLEKLNLAGDPQAVAGSKGAGKGKRAKKDEERPKEENEEGKKECATKEEGPKDPKQTKAEKDAKRGAAGAGSSAQTKAEKDAKRGAAVAGSSSDGPAAKRQKAT